MPSPAPEIKGITTPHEVDKESGNIDKNGRATASVTYRVATINEAATFTASHPLGIPEVGRSWTLLTGGLGYEVTIEYEGYLDEQDEEDEHEYTLDISYSEEPIEAHPNLEKIKKVYRGGPDPDDPKKVVFTEYIERGEATGLGGGETSGNRIKNPMFGVKTYLVLKAVFRDTYLSDEKPKLDRIGEIVDSIPGGYDTPRRHNWLRMPPKSRRKGKGQFEITDEYILSVLGGWTPHVHQIIEHG